MPNPRSIDRTWVINLNPNGITLIDRFDRTYDTPLGTGREGITLPEEKGFNKGPSRITVKWLGEDVRGVLLRMNVVETDISGRNSFADAVVGECIPTFGELGVRNGGASDNGLVITKHPGRAIKRDTKGAESVTQVHNLLSSSPSSNKLTAVGSSFDLSLAFGEPIDGCLVEEVEDTGGRPASDGVMHEVGIFVGGGADHLAFGRRKAMRDLFLGGSVD